MSKAKVRAVAVCFHGDEILVIKRSKRERRFAVLPGGGVKTGENSADAALRELREETGLEGVLTHHLWTLTHGERTADYFAVDVAVGPMWLSGPELARQSPENTYQPAWILTSALDDENLRPKSIRPLLLPPRDSAPSVDQGPASASDRTFADSLAWLTVLLQAGPTAGGGVAVVHHRAWTAHDLFHAMAIDHVQNPGSALNT